MSTIMRYDIAVVGLGTAGSLAAIAAGRQGVRVLALESGTYAGGMQSGGFICGYFQQQPVGLSAEMENRARQLCENRRDLSGIEAKKWLLERELLLYCDLRYQIVLTRVDYCADKEIQLSWREGDDICHAQVGVVIDATGNSDVVALAGGETQGGRVSDELGQHSSMVMQCCQPRQDQQHQQRRQRYESVCLRVNPRDIREYSHACLEATTQLSEQLENGKNIIVPADLPGLREGRHIIPRQLFTLSDVLLGDGAVQQSIAWVSASVDTNIDDYAWESQILSDWLLVANGHGFVLNFAVPMQCLFPVGFDNIIAAGKHLGVDHDLGHALRMNSAMGAIGEAAGIISAMAVRMGISAADVSYTALKDKLSLLELPGQWLSDQEEIRAGLVSAHSSAQTLALWSVYRLGRLDWLRQWLSEEQNQELRQRLIFALGLLRDSSVVSMLKLLARQRRGRVSRVALYLLGRYDRAELVDFFIEFLDSEWVRFPQGQAETVMSLLRLGDSYPDLRLKIRQSLLDVSRNPKWVASCRFLRWSRRRVRIEDRLRRQIS